jgi:predicted nucleic acid-binding protein
MPATLSAASRISSPSTATCRSAPVDASVIAAAERLDATEVATLDRRHFSVVRSRHEVGFQLLP